MLKNTLESESTIPTSVVSSALMRMAKREQDFIETLFRKIRYELDFVEGDKTTRGRIEGLKYALIEFGVSPYEIEQRISQWLSE